MRGIDFIATAAAVGVFGYFVWKVILPKLGDLQLPTWQPPAQQEQPVQYQQPAATTTPDQVPPAQPIEQDPESKKPKQEEKEDKPKSVVPSRSPPSSVATPPPASAGGAGMTIGFKTTGKKVVMNVARLDENGQRYNNNHKFTNYLMSGLFKLSPSSTLIEMKTDGPNHSGCAEVPKCFWAEPRFDTSGKSSLSMEMPHVNRKDYPISCPSCKSIPGSYAGKWIGYAVAAYGPQGGRVVEQWVDPTGTGTKWQLTLREKIDARWHGAANRPLPFEGDGLEAEIRMIDAVSGQDMKNCFVYEIVPPSSAGFATTNIRKLMIDEPYLFNGYYGRRRL